MLNKKSVTLFEMVMVMAIITITGMIIGPKWVNLLHEWDLETEGRKMVSKLREIQQLSRRDRMNYGIVVDVDNDCYEVGYDTGTAFVAFSDPDSPICFENDIDIYGTSMWTPPSWLLPRTVVFDPFGVPQISNTAEIYLQDPSGNELHVRVLPVTGRVRIKTN